MTKDELREKMKMLFSTPFYFSSYEDLSRFTDSIIEDFDSYAKQKALETAGIVINLIKVEIEQAKGNHYHNIGIGSLDYHEKNAVDAYITTLLHRLNTTFQEIRNRIGGEE